MNQRQLSLKLLLSHRKVVAHWLLAGSGSTGDGYLDKSELGDIPFIFRDALKELVHDSRLKFAR